MTDDNAVTPVAAPASVKKPPANKPADATQVGPPYMPMFSWDKDKLVTTDEVKLEKIVRKNLSASSSNSLRGCMAKFAAESVLPRSEDPFGPAELGTSAHDVLEHLYLLPPKKRTLASADKLIFDLSKKQWSSENLTQRTTSTNAVNGEIKKRWEEEVAHRVHGDFELEDPTQVDVFQPEWGLEGLPVPVPDGRLIPMVGFIDRTDFAEDGTLLIRDYKAGKYRPHNPRFDDDYGDQQRLYTVAAEVVLLDPELRAQYFTADQIDRLLTAGKLKVSDVRLLYIAARKERVIDIAPAARNLTMSGFARSWDKMQAAGKSGEFPTTPGPLCGWCPLVNSCPVAKVTTDKARASAETQPSKTDLGIPVIKPFGHTESVVDYTSTRTTLPAAPVAEKGTTAAPAGTVGAAPSARNATKKSAAPVADMTTTKEDTMVTPFVPEGVIYSEDAAFKPSVNYPDGARANLNSYGFIAASSLTTFAFELINENKVPFSKENLQALATTLGKIVWKAERDLTNGSFSWDHGLHSRLRGYLRDAIRVKSVPFGKSAAEWEQWVASIIGAVEFLAESSYRLYNTDFEVVTTPYAALTSENQEKK